MLYFNLPWGSPWSLRHELSKLRPLAWWVWVADDNPRKENLTDEIFKRIIVLLVVLHVVLLGSYLNVNHRECNVVNNPIDRRIMQCNGLVGHTCQNFDHVGHLTCRLKTQLKANLTYSLMQSLKIKLKLYDCTSMQLAMQIDSDNNGIRVP